MKYMLAMLCSKPAATKAVMGKTDGDDLVDAAAGAERQPHGEGDQGVAEDPQRDAWPKPRFTLLFATFSAVAPIWWSLNSHCCEAYTSSTVRIAPAKFPAYTSPQFRSSSGVETLRLAQAMMISVLPVNSSAPAMTTRTSPRLNATPPSIRVGPKPSSASVTVTVNSIAPSEMKAPASPASTSVDTRSMRALAAPTRSQASAICGGSSASNETAGWSGIRASPRRYRPGARSARRRP